MHVGGLVFGLLVFLVPAALFTWSVLTKKGRETYARGVRESENWPRWGGIPLKSPKLSVVGLTH